MLRIHLCNCTEYSHMLAMFIYHFIFLLTLNIVKCTLIGPMLGPADIEFLSMEYCDMEQRKGIDLTITKRKFNRTVHVYDIYLDTQYILDNTFTIEFKGSLKRDGGYKQGSTLIKKPLCEGFHLTLGEIFNQYLNATGRSDCPFEPGSYEVNSFYVDNPRFTVPKVYGDYKMDVFVWKNNDLIRCFNGFYKLIPKSDE